MNRIIKIEISLMPNNGQWQIAVTKEFSSEYGGGTHTFLQSAGHIHHALDIARGMVTMSPATNPDVEVTRG